MVAPVGSRHGSHVWVMVEKKAGQNGLSNGPSIDAERAAKASPERRASFAAIEVRIMHISQTMGPLRWLGFPRCPSPQVTKMYSRDKGAYADRASLSEQTKDGDGDRLCLHVLCGRGNGVLCCIPQHDSPARGNAD